MVGDETGDGESVRAILFLVKGVGLRGNGDIRTRKVPYAMVFYYTPTSLLLSSVKKTPPTDTRARFPNDSPSSLIFIHPIVSQSSTPSISIKPKAFTAVSHIGQFLSDTVSKEVRPSSLVNQKISARATEWVRPPSVRGR